MKNRLNPFICNSFAALIVTSFCASSLQAGTTWDGGGGATTNIDEALNWGGTVNAIDGTTAATFATGGNSASMNVPARFTTLTFNRDDAAGFTIGGASILSVNQSTAGGTINLAVSDLAANGITSITAPLQVYTNAGGTNRFLNIKNDEKDIPGGSLLISGGITASTPANTYAIRAGGTGVTVLSGTLSHVSAIQQVNSGTSSGKVVINGNQSLGSATVNIPSTLSGTVSSAYTIQMGAASTDVQSWGATSINQPSTVVVKSTATLTGAVGVGNAAALSGATLVVDGSLTSASTLALGGASVTGNLKIGGSASFTGAVTIGAAAGSTIIGNAATNGTLSLSSGTISGSVSIGGAGTNENNLNLTKINSGTLVLNGTHTYTGTTTVEAGTLELSGDIVSATTIQSGGKLNISGTTSGPVTVNSGGSIGGEGSLNNTLTVGTGTSTLNYSLTGPLNATSVDVSAATAIIVSAVAPPVSGTPYVVLKRSSGTFSGADFGKFVSTRGGPLSLTGGDTEITIIPTGVPAASLVWTGNNSSDWESSLVENWSNAGNPDRFYFLDAVSFDDTATNFTVTVPGTSVTPGNIVFNNTSLNDYTLSGGALLGTGALTKSNSGTVTIDNALSHSGGISVSGGTLNLNGGSSGGGATTISGGGTLNLTSAISGGGAVTVGGAGILSISGTGSISPTTGATLTIGGSSAAGTLQYHSSATSNFGTINVGNGTASPGTLNQTEGKINASALTLNPNYSGSGTGTVALSGGTLAISGAVTVSGQVVSDNTYSNLTVSGSGALTVGSNLFMTGAPAATRNAAGRVTQDGGTVTLAGTLNMARTTASNSAARRGEYNLNGGTLTANQITQDAGSDTFGTFNFNGGTLKPKANSSTFMQGLTTANVKDGGAIIDTAGFDITIAQPLVHFAGATTDSLTKDGLGTLTLTGASNYSSSTTVNRGTLKLGTINPGNETSTVTVASGAKIDIAFTGNDTVGALILGGTNVPAGSYNSSHPTYGSYFLATGTGSIVVVPAVSGYAAWQLANAPGQTVDQDHDNDGVKNGIEYFMGESGTSFTANPTVVSGAITWPMGATYTGTYGTDYVVQTSPDLTTWTPATVGVGAGFVTINPATSVTYTLTAPAGKLFVRLLVNPN